MKKTARKETLEITFTVELEIADGMSTEEALGYIGVEAVDDFYVKVENEIILDWKHEEDAS